VLSANSQHVRSGMFEAVDTNLPEVGNAARVDDDSIEKDKCDPRTSCARTNGVVRMQMRRINGSIGDTSRG